MRENGNYWVKPQVTSKWEVADSVDGYWWRVGDCYGANDSCFDEINPQRILTPDEKASNKS